MPSIVNGLFSGRSGISSHGTAIAILADNISNANTTAYKASRPEFQDLLAGGLGGGGSVAVGSGSNMNAATQVFSQGTFEFTGRGLDLAIDGKGFFIVSDGVGGARYYTRAGNFKIDTDGNVLNQNGMLVLGYPANGSGGLEPLNLNTVSQADVETENVTIGGNLDAASAITAIPGGSPTFSQLASSATFSTFVDVFDSLGAAHTVTVYFWKTAANTWQSRAYVDAGEVGGAAGSPAQIGGTATLNFTSSGVRSGAIPAFDIQATPAWSNGAAATPIDFLFDPLTQYSSGSNISSIIQDGKGAGNVVSFNVEQDGTLFAIFDNGQSSSIGQVGIASFANEEALRRQGGSLYTKSNESGEPVVGVAASGQYGSIQAGSLELSNSDIAADFIKLISLQRGFQGSSRIITSIDDLLNEIINLAR